MKSQVASYVMMAIGAVSALIFAAGPLATSRTFQILFGVSTLLLAGGAAMRRVGARAAARSGDSDGEVERSYAALDALGRALKQASEDSASVKDMPRFHQRVYGATQPPIRDFLLHRQALLDARGIGSFAELMIRFASVERAINRTLSASADGHSEEARSCLQKAKERMEDCLAVGRRDD